jgi:hypothetical protein
VIHSCGMRSSSTAFFFGGCVTANFNFMGEAERGQMWWSYFIITRLSTLETPEYHLEVSSRSTHKFYSFVIALILP